MTLSERQYEAADLILADHARTEFDERDKPAWQWLCDQTVDCCDEVRMVVFAALHLNAHRTPEPDFCDLDKAADALREKYAEEREWDEIDRRQVFEQTEPQYD
jgi:hypothetical protein